MYFVHGKDHASMVCVFALEKGQQKTRAGDTLDSAAEKMARGGLAHRNASETLQNLCQQVSNNFIRRVILPRRCVVSMMSPGAGAEKSTIGGLNG